MKKVIVIDGKEVAFKSSAAFFIKYKNQFGKEFFKELAKIKNLDGLSEEELLEKLDLNVLYEIAWTLAYMADNTIPPLEDWLDSFGEFPIEVVFHEVMELLTKSMGTNQKKTMK